MKLSEGYLQYRNYMDYFNGPVCPGEPHPAIPTFPGSSSPVYSRAHTQPKTFGDRAERNIPTSVKTKAIRSGGCREGASSTLGRSQYMTIRPGSRPVNAHARVHAQQPGLCHSESAHNDNNGNFIGNHITSDRTFHDRVRVLAAGTHKPPPPGLVRTKTSRRDTLGRPYGFTHVPVDSPRHERVVRLKSKRYKGHYLELMDIHSDDDSGTSSDNDGGFHRPSVARDCKTSKPGGRIAHVRETTSGPHWQYGMKKGL